MGNAPFLKEPDTAKESGDGESTYGTYGFSSMQGWRTGQEDAHAIAGSIARRVHVCTYRATLLYVAVLERGKKELVDYFAVFDGHGGAEV